MTATAWGKSVVIMLTLCLALTRVVPLQNSEKVGLVLRRGFLSGSFVCYSMDKWCLDNFRSNAPSLS